MSNNIHITVNDGHLLHEAFLTEDATATNSFTINGKRYAVVAQEGELGIVLDALNALYPETVTSAKPLSGRVSQLDASVVGLEQVLGVWMQQDEIYLTELKRKTAESYLANPKGDSEDLRMFLLQKAFPKKVPDDFENRFNQALATKNVQLFLSLLDQIYEDDLCTIIYSLELGIPTRQDVPCNQWSFTDQAKRELKQYVQDLGFSGSLTLQDSNHTPFSVTSEGIDPATPFAMHSVGKVFTGILALRLIHLGKLDKKVLDEPVQLAPSVIEGLPKNVQRHLKENGITLRQLMLHEGGLGEYLDNYIFSINLALESKTNPPKMGYPEDFLQYAEEKTYPVGQVKYSNLGLLLVGLSAQYLTQRSFDDLLREYIIIPAKIGHFSSHKPEDAKINPSDPVAEHLCGSPAGGYWTTSADLCRFGGWICQECKDSTFLQLMETYGSEFYSRGELYHDGVIPSASACLCVFPERDVTVAILSNKNYPGAIEMNTAIKNHMLHTRPSR